MLAKVNLVAKQTIAVLIVFFSLEAYSECNFSTGSYIDELDNPSHILLIEVRVPKSSSYAKNLFKIYSSKTKHIPPNLKKKFKANIIVHHTFGECIYKATIRQSGDWKDHITLKNGQPTRSLDVKLKNGNILNAVGFKLLVPATRNGLNEVLASVILKDLGFIVPETFEVNTSINGVDSVMLFQEKSAKELLERNLKREGPIFEGDESLLWSYRDYERFELEPIATSRLVNDSWFEKGKNSQAIVLQSYAILQNAYLEYGYKNQKNKYEFSLFPNIIEDNKTINYHAALIAMNGKHGLRPHNRKFYYNALEDQFEPIYYDGDVNLLQSLDLSYWEKYDSIKSVLPRNPSINFIKLSQSLNSNGKLKENFLNRVTNLNQADKFFQNGITQFKENMNIFNTNQTIKLLSENFDESFIEPNYEWYQNFMDLKGVEQRIVTGIDFKDNYFRFSFQNKGFFEGTADNVSKLLTRNNLEEKKSVYIPVININSKKNEYKSMNIGSNFIRMSKGINVEIIEDQKTIKFVQSDPLDWVLIANGDLSFWNITFNGLEYVRGSTETTKQRFNDFGLTGCLTIYNSQINQSNFSANDGGCEDSINIINSFGKNITVIVKNAQADAIDADFSDLEFENLNIINAANDCFDVSGGSYIIKYGILKNCQDKAISVGEKSSLKVNEIIINDANIGVAAKDLSKVLVLQMEANNINICADVKRKKQEFGGAELIINDYKCSAKIDVDAESVFISGDL